MVPITAYFTCKPTVTSSFEHEAHFSVDSMRCLGILDLIILNIYFQ